MANWFLSLKGSFYQPWPKARERRTEQMVGPVGAVHLAAGTSMNEPFRLENTEAPIYPGLRPGLIERAFQARKTICHDVSSSP
jgi:hypothetical protein